MTLFSTLAAIVAMLEGARIPHMVTGSLASTYYAEPRTTQDIDLVIDPTPERLARFVDAIDRSRYYVGDAAVAMRDRSQFNVIDVTTGWKVDLIVKRDRAFSETEFERRQSTDLGDVRVHLATAEDVILAKLEWAVSGESERQRRDVVAIVRAVGDELDVEYLRAWAPRLEVADGLESVLSEGAPDA